MMFPDGWEAWVDSLRTAEFTETEFPARPDPSAPDLSPFLDPDLSRPGSGFRVRVNTQRRHELPDVTMNDRWPGWYFRQSWRLSPGGGNDTLAYICYEQDEQGNARITGHLREDEGWTFIAQTRTFREVFSLVMEELVERGMLHGS